MSVRLKLGLTIFATGIVTTLLVMAAVIWGFQRFERETAYRRGSAFLQRVEANHDNLFEQFDRRPDEFQAWLNNLVLFEPDTQLYLLDAAGLVLACSGAPLPQPTRVALTPVLEAVGRADAAYVMGDDPKRMDADAVIAVQPVRRTLIRNTEPVAGYLYLVLHTQQLPESRWAALRMSIARPALGLIVAVVGFTTLLAVCITVSVTRPLQRLTEALAAISRRGLDAELAGSAPAALPAVTRDEFGQLARAFEMMLATLRRQWGELRRLDHFRREGVSNLSHDLRSPLTATVACLETLDARWARSEGVATTSSSSTTGDTTGDTTADDRRLIEIALRNTRNAARLVQSLGDLAKLDEPEFKLHPEVVDLAELLDDIAIRFTERAAQQGVTLRADPTASRAAPSFAAIDIELFERAVANLVDNALKFCPRGAAITLAAHLAEGRVEISVADTGPGIAAVDLPHLFDRFYQSRQSVAPATGEGGKGLGLAIVKRIAELHGGAVSVASERGVGTTVTVSLKAAGA